MLVQDTLTGALHEVPEVSGYSGYGYYGEPEPVGYYGEPEPVGELYDGFGNPVGFLPFLAPLASAIAPLAAKALPALANAIPGVGQLVSSILPGAAPGAPPGLPVPTPPLPALPFPPLPPGLPGLPGFPGLPGMQPPMPFGPQLPPGWMRPPMPYTGLAPRRRYMRCVSWPGPPGLVPTSAAMTPGQPLPGQAAVVAAATAPIRRRFRFRRRR